jgi:hypothetical protein
VLRAVQRREKKRGGEEKGREGGDESGWVSARFGVYDVRGTDALRELKAIKCFERDRRED